MDEQASQTTTDLATEVEALSQPSNPIITQYDPQRFHLLEMESAFVPLPLSPDDIEVVQNMGIVLDHLGDEALGLAAVQVGIPKRLFLLRFPDGDIRTYINPSLVSTSKERVKRNEACLSLPGMVVQTNRPKKLTLRYFDALGTEHTEEFTGIMARAVCHEMDHLNGILIHRYLEDQIAKHVEKQKRIKAEKQKRKEKRRAKQKKAKRAKRR